MKLYDLREGRQDTEAWRRNAAVAHQGPVQDNKSNSEEKP